MNELDSPFFMRGVPLNGPHDHMKDAMLVIKADQVLIRFNKLARKLFPEFNIEGCIINIAPFPLGEVPGPQLVRIRTMKRISGKDVCVDRMYAISEVANITAKKLLAFHMENIVNLLIDEFTKKKVKH